MGFDLVAFSGGKGIRGPQSAGLLLGRKDLIEAARAERAAQRQHHRPRHEGEQGRDARACWWRWSCSSKKDHAAEGREFERRAEAIRKSAAAVPGVKAEVFVPEVANHVPHVRITWDGGTRSGGGGRWSSALRDGEPSIGIRVGGGQRSSSASG